MISPQKARPFLQGYFLRWTPPKHRFQRADDGIVQLDEGAGHSDLRAHIAPSYLTLFNEQACHKFGCINSNGKTDPLCSQDHRCIDADDISPGCDKGPSGISRIEGSVCPG